MNEWYAKDTSNKIKAVFDARMKDGKRCSGSIPYGYNRLATNSTTCPTVRKQIGKTTYIVRVHFSQTAKETMEDKIKRLLREEVRKM